MYQISNYGRIKSLTRKRDGMKRIEKEHIINQFNDGNGYKQFSLFKNKKKISYKTHRILAQTFLPNPNNYPCVNHIDGNKQNNKISNLEWCTYKYNTKHAWDIGLCSTKKFKHYTTQVAKLNENNKVLETYSSQKIASKLNNISYKALNMCLRGKSKTSGGYKWKYVNERGVK